MSRFKKLSKTALSSWRPLLILAIALTFVGCFSDDDTRPSPTPKVQRPAGSVGAGNGADFHGVEFASIKNLDPRGEECVDCHGLSNDMSPISGKKAHNIGLQKFDTAKTLGVEGIEITSVKVNETTGVVTVTLNQALPAGANFGLTFAKLAPRVIHNRGHDWQNYFASSDLAFGERRKASQGIKMLLEKGGAQPLLAPNPQVSGKTITFNLGDGDKRSWGKHDFTVKSAYETDTEEYKYENILGTKVATEDLANHIYCDAAHDDANQTETTANKKAVCWWPDGTHLTAGVFVTKDNELVVEYQPDYTHRVALIVNGSPGHNVWFDFVPSVANGDKTVVKTSEATGNTDTELVVPDDAPNYIAANGRVLSSVYGSASGDRNLPPFGIQNAAGVIEHQALPAARDVVDVQSCNSCHDSLSMHGGSRSQTQTCVTCHNPGNLQASSGRSMDFKVLIHRIHRGNDLPSEQTATVATNQLLDSSGNPQVDAEGKPITLTAKAISELLNGESLVADSATDFTKVRFPQGPSVGAAAGITNCVKCHMGSETKDLVQDIANDIGPGLNYDVQSKMKLAKVTPQGDNWLSVRNVNACQACHDSNVWLSGGGSISALNQHRFEEGVDFGFALVRGSPTEINPVDPEDSSFQLEKYLPFYSDKYTDVGYKWLGKKLTRNEASGWIHNTQVPSNNGRFTCGSSGGCHGNNAIDGLSSTPNNTGDRASNNIHRVHLELTRDFIISERFEIQVKDVKVDETGFSVEVDVIDKKTGQPVKSGDTPTGLGEITLGLNAMFGWMANGSPDYNHSTGGGFGSGANGSAGQPAAPTALTGLDADGKLTLTWDELNAAGGTTYNWETDFNKATSFGTVALNATLTIDGKAHRLRSANQDFSFADGMLAAGELARRQVVDFTAGRGVEFAHEDGNTQSCQSCHLQLNFHGPTASNNTQMCVMCHNPNLTDLRARTKDADGNVILGADGQADGQYEESEDFKRLIHAVHAAGDGFRIDPFQTRGNLRPSPEGEGPLNHHFPGVLSNCQSCHIESEAADALPGQWTFELTQLPKGQIGSTMITGDWANQKFDPKGGQHDLNNHMKMTPIASVCSSCHDAGYKTNPTEGRMNNNNAPEGGPYIGSHWWMQGGIAPGIVAPGEKPESTKHQSGK